MKCEFNLVGLFVIMSMIPVFLMCIYEISNGYSEIIILWNMNAEFTHTGRTLYYTDAEILMFLGIFIFFIFTLCYYLFNINFGIIDRVKEYDGKNYDEIIETKIKNFIKRCRKNGKKEKR